MKQDFHMHSCYSNDGEFSPKELCELAQKNNCSIIALTDHNSVYGVDEMIEEADKLGIQVIPGIEIDTEFEGIDFHLTVYGMDYNDPRYEAITIYYTELERKTSKEALSLFEEHFDVFIDRMDLMRIEKDGILVPEDLGDYLLNNPKYDDAEFLKEYRAGASRSDNPYLNFYLDYFAQGKVAYVKDKKIDIDSILEMVEETQGIAVVAHPGHNFNGHFDVLQKLLDKPQIKGIEVYSNYHTEEMTRTFLEYAKTRDLVVTCGSDFHGKNKPAIQLGQIKFVPDDFESGLVDLVKVNFKD
ncbi:PHP domain-containing protein [Anaerorhabdus sp.]|uniref:PHP domain-containing protein n=1 Tax=Anaerorhabdus sp. TaxID=1872524 RepID=UPI002FCA0C3C